MALLAETLVEEWLNRLRFFTIRGVRQGVDEIDLLAVRYREAQQPEAWHVESQVSFRPIGYITPLARELARELGKKSTSVFRRTDQQLEQCVTAWLGKKFYAKRKVAARESLWPGAKWQFVLVHGTVKHPAELGVIAAHGVTLLPLSTILQELCAVGSSLFTGTAGGDLAELIAFYAGQKGGTALGEQQQESPNPPARADG
jgi:hypothetical protein